MSMDQSEATFGAVYLAQFFFKMTLFRLRCLRNNIRCIWTNMKQLFWDLELCIYILLVFFAATNVLENNDWYQSAQIFASLICWSWNETLYKPFLVTFCFKSLQGKDREETKIEGILKGVPFFTDRLCKNFTVDIGISKIGCFLSILKTIFCLAKTLSWFSVECR